MAPGVRKKKEDLQLWDLLPEAPRLTNLSPEYGRITKEAHAVGLKIFKFFKEHRSISMLWGKKGFRLRNIAMTNRVLSSCTYPILI
jgi:hypothetical protein